MNGDPDRKKTEPPEEKTPQGIQLTPSQDAVLDVLQQQQHPLSAQSLYILMRKQQPIGLATIYRSLNALQRLGLIQRRVSMRGESLYGAIEPDRHYLTCLQCGASFPLETCPVRQFEAQLQRSGSFKIYYHTLEFFGLCEPCADRES